MACPHCKCEPTAVVVDAELRRLVEAAIQKSPPMFSKAHEGTEITIKEGAVIIDDTCRSMKLKWVEGKHADGKASVVSVVESLNGKVQLQGGLTFENPASLEPDDRDGQHMTPGILKHAHGLCMRIFMDVHGWHAPRG